MQREIWLTDKNNTESFRFTAFGDFIFSSPTSLGVYRNKSFLVVNNQRITIEDVPSFKTITGTIIIKGLYGELEDKYASLRDFVSKHIKTGFRLYVKPKNDISARYIYCDIDTLDKTEKMTGTMIVPINILPKSLWLGDAVGLSISKKNSVAGLLRFAPKNDKYLATFVKRENMQDEFGRDIYSVAFGNGWVGQTFIFNGGEETTPLIVRIYGNAVNPFVTLRATKTGEILQSVKFSNFTVDENSYIEINSNPEDAYIDLVNKHTGERRDIEDFADQDTTIFMKLPVGDYVIEVEDDLLNNDVQTRVFATQQFYGV